MKRRYTYLVNYLICTLLLAASPLSHAGFFDYFNEEDGSTNWQYVANWSSGILIFLLMITSAFLFFNMRKAYRANNELNLIKDNLEHLVGERTEMLEGEVEQHKQTAHLLKSSEAYIKSIVDSMPLMLIGLNKKLEVTQWNAQAEKITGIGIEEAIGKYLWDAYPTITISPERVMAALDEGETTTIKHIQRGQYYFDITLYPLVDQPETGIVVLVDDVTQESKAANLLIEKDKFSAMGELASAMAHDISIPLGAIEKTLGGIKPYLKELEDHSSDVLSLLDQGYKDSRQASAIINHLISFASSDSEKKPTSIPDMIDRAIEVASLMFSDTGGLMFSDIEISKTYADELHLVPCHASEMQQVFISLLRHACYALGGSHSKSFKPAIGIDVSEFYDSVWVKIQHNGVGLNAEEQMTLFEPFYQNEDMQQGCDMENRLSFPFFIVTEHHEGQMAVTSDINVGTTFHIQLQLK